MPADIPKQAWEARLREAASHVEDEVRRVLTYINEDVMPDVRRNGSDALRTAAAELQKLAQKMDEANHKTPPPPPPPTAP